MRSNREKGQAILLVLLAMATFMIGAMGLAIDVSQLYGNHQMAQVAADAAAQAAMLSIFQGVDKVGSGIGDWPSSGFTCAAGDSRVPCKYAQMNGFGNDTVKVSFPVCTTYPNAECSTALTPNEVQVSITRNVSNTFIRMVGAGAMSKVGATGIAAAYQVVCPVPILVLHPTLSGALNGNGTTDIVITGGPSRSIQVNSSSPTAYQAVTSVDLSKAGPNANGADFGVFGGPKTQPGGFNFGTLPGKYRQPASPIPDPLLFVCAPGDSACLSAEGKPNDPAIPTAPAPLSVKSADTPNYGCTSSCDLYRPGLYSSGINVQHGVAIFQPGVYVMGDGNGFGTSANGTAQMCIVKASDIPTGSTGWPNPGAGCITDPGGQTGDGMVVYNQSGGTFTVTGGGSSRLLGTPATDALGNPTRYAGMLFFQDRSSPPALWPKSHDLGGNGCIDLVGTIYTTNTLVTMTASSGHYQELSYHGTPCSGTALLGEIITDKLSLKGTPLLKMLLNPQAFLKIQQVALVGGGPQL